MIMVRQPRMKQRVTRQSMSLAGFMGQSMAFGKDVRHSHIGHPIWS